ncbi:MAG: hypothetical protein CSA97_05310 [Bacteroidetes bacterium]|nr:MAG: hypothetical protein CSA97_05310 [Bacteroidota bacterium]
MEGKAKHINRAYGMQIWRIHQEYTQNFAYPNDSMTNQQNSGLPNPALQKPIARYGSLRQGVGGFFVHQKYSIMKRLRRLVGYTLLCGLLLHASLSHAQMGRFNFSGGDGTEASPYLIGTYEDLKALSKAIADGASGYETAHYQQTADITIGADFVPIGTSEFPFKGYYNGQLYEIKDLKLASTGADGELLGLFGDLKKAIIRSLVFDNARITVSHDAAVNAGILAGRTNDGEVALIYTKPNCRIVADITISGLKGVNRIGAIVGSNGSGNTKIQLCEADGQMDVTLSPGSIAAGGPECGLTINDTQCEPAIGITYPMSTRINLKQPASTPGKEFRLDFSYPASISLISGAFEFTDGSGDMCGGKCLYTDAATIAGKQFMPPALYAKLKVAFPTSSPDPLTLIEGLDQLTKEKAEEIELASEKLWFRVASWLIPNGGFPQVVWVAQLEDFRRLVRSNANHPYTLANYEELRPLRIANDIGKHEILPETLYVSQTADIDCQGDPGFLPFFTGDYKGNGHAVRNVHLTDQNLWYSLSQGMGIFTELTGHVENLVVEDCSIIRAEDESGTGGLFTSSTDGFELEGITMRRCRIELSSQKEFYGLKTGLISGRLLDGTTLRGVAVEDCLIDVQSLNENGSSIGIIAGELAGNASVERCYVRSCEIRAKGKKAGRPTNGGTMMKPVSIGGAFGKIAAENTAGIPQASPLLDCTVENTSISISFTEAPTGDEAIYAGGLCGRLMGKKDGSDPAKGSLNLCGVQGLSIDMGSTPTPASIGGLVGYATENISLENCSAVGSTIKASDMTGEASHVGGLVGELAKLNDVLITDCYATGSIAGPTTSNSTTAGFIGFSDQYTNAPNKFKCQNTYCDATISGTSDLLRPYVIFMNRETETGITEPLFEHCYHVSEDTPDNQGKGMPATLIAPDKKTDETQYDGFYFSSIWSIGAPAANIATPILRSDLATQIRPQGNGTKSDPYQIATLQDLKWMSLLTSAQTKGVYFQQVADIDASETKNWNIGPKTKYDPVTGNNLGFENKPYGFSPIGPGKEAFKGYYDGQGYRIENLFIDPGHNAQELGLFGVITEGASVKNVLLISPTVRGKKAIGALVGNIAISGKVENCTVEGATITAKGKVGGLIGIAFGTNITIAGCTVRASSIAGWDGIPLAQRHKLGKAGGLIGQAHGEDGYPVKFERCAVESSDIKDIVELGGGLAGDLLHTEAQNCYAQASLAAVNDLTSIGGFVGAEGEASFASCYAASSIVLAEPGQPEVALTDKAFCSSTTPKTGVNLQDCYFVSDQPVAQTNAGFPAAAGELTAITQAELQSGSLPEGFSPEVWSAKAGEYPRLISRLMYTVSFDLNGGDGAIAPIKVAKGQPVAKPSTPQREGYTFVEWQLNGETYSFATPVEQHITLKAIWEKNPEQEPGTDPEDGDGDTDTPVSLASTNLVLTPNPVTDRLEVLGLKESTQAQVYNLYGQGIRTERMAPGENLNLADLKPGIYILRIAGQSLRFVKK